MSAAGEGSASIAIRDERPQDIDAIRALNDAAFGQRQEGRLVDALRANGGITLSLVATLADRVVGHILYSPVSVGADGPAVVGAGLGPMAVLPEFQRQGIGGKLIEAGNERLRVAGCPFVVVLGHADYYPRFGFRPASGVGMRCEWEVPDELFMVRVMDPPTLKGLSGVVRYRPEFSGVI